jgi:predicted GH43/DUF377 family glycosyl hydrolase
MRRLLWAVLLVFPLTGALAQDTRDLFTLVSAEPVVEHGPTSDWDGIYADPGAVFYHDGQFHMFRNGFRRWPGFVDIGYATSPDGITWTDASDEPVLSTDDVPYAETAALASSVLVEDDGTWVLYFYTFNTGENSASGNIGRATADNPLGPWQVDAEPVLTPGSSGSWDEQIVMAPRVVQTDGGYVMYYEGGSSAGFGSAQIGMATSPDGVTWTKRDDPILSAGEGEMMVHQPLVQITPNGWIMIYRSLVGRGNMQLGLAFSEDGINWMRAEDPIFWNKTDIPRTSGFWYTALAYHDDTFYLYIEAGRASTDIYAATFTGQLE